MTSKVGSLRVSIKFINLKSDWSGQKDKTKIDNIRMTGEIYRIYRDRK